MRKAQKVERLRPPPSVQFALSSDTLLVETTMNPQTTEPNDWWQRGSHPNLKQIQQMIMRKIPFIDLNVQWTHEHKGHPNQR